MLKLPGGGLHFVIPAVSQCNFDFIGALRHILTYIVNIIHNPFVISGKSRLHNLVAYTPAVNGHHIEAKSTYADLSGFYAAWQLESPPEYRRSMAGASGEGDPLGVPLRLPFHSFTFSHGFCLLGRVPGIPKG
ncbi:hypothetical protein D3C75_605220 [compost metagenome]